MKRIITAILFVALFLPMGTSAVEVIVGERDANDDVPFCGG